MVTAIGTTQHQHNLKEKQKLTADVKKVKNFCNSPC